MLWTMMKNNVKLMFRSKFIILMMICTPIIVVAALSSAFNNLLEDSKEYKRMNIGYATKQGSALDTFFDNNKEEFSKKKLDLKKYGKDEGKELVESGKLKVLIQENGEEVEIYTLDEHSIAARMSQYMVNQFYLEYENASRDMVANTLTKTKLSTAEKIQGTKFASASDYYGIVELIYFVWCGVLLLTGVIQSERKNRISQRYITAPTNSLKLYAAKFIPCYVMTMVCTAISAVACILLFDIHWGRPAATVGMFCIMGLAAVSYGILCVYLVNNMAVSVVLIFITVWAAGFTGGSFETYMFSLVPEKIKALSPIYYMNRTLVEYSTMGQSEYATTGIILLLGIFVVCSIVGVLLMKRRMEVE